MNDKRREKNCEKCNLRKTQELYSGKEFDYRNCPYVCLQNKVDYFNTGFVNNPRPRTRAGVMLAK